MKKLILAGIIFLIFITAIYIQSRSFPVVIKVIDGDTFDLDDGRTIRLMNVDTPELEDAQCFATEAARLVRRLLINEPIKVETDLKQLDTFGRTLAYVFLADGTMVNEKILTEGWGEYFSDDVNVKYRDRLVAAAQKGHDQIRGLWRICAPDPQLGCLIKGNLNKWDVRRYVLPESRHYTQTVVNLDQWDRWFCTEEEAIKAGFAKARI